MVALTVRPGENNPRDPGHKPPWRETRARCKQLVYGAGDADSLTTFHRQPARLGHRTRLRRRHQGEKRNVLHPGRAGKARGGRPGAKHRHRHAGPSQFLRHRFGQRQKIGLRRMIDRHFRPRHETRGGPDLETRIAILEAKMTQEGIEIPQNVTEFICYNIQNNIRELEGVLVSLVAQSSLNQQEVDLELAKKVIRNFVKQINKEITVDYIQKLVADHFDLGVEKLQGKTRKRQVVIARQLSMYLAKNLTDKSLKAIGENFGGRDHSTVIYSCKTVQDLMETDVIFKDTVADLEKKIKMSLHEQ